MQNASLIAPTPQSAEVLDNFFPTAEGLRLRRGSSLHATLDGDVVQLMTHTSGASSALFAATATKVFDVTSPADPEVTPSADISSLTSGDWSYLNFGTSGGNFLFMVNGSDSARHYNGTTWATPSITNLTSSNATFAWAFKQRIFMVEKETLSAWYLPADAVAGAATEFPLRSVFTLGGALLFGATWSLDSGEGLDDVCVFVTDQGEIAVYQGTDPSSASTFALQGVYQISRPLSKHASFRAGGDLAIATEDGIISLAAAVQQDRAALSRSAVTYPIEDAWRSAVTLRNAAHSFNTTIWHSQTLLIVSVPDDFDGTKQAFVANARTGAWCRYTGWDVQCSAVHDDQLYFGTNADTILKAEVTGADQDAPYTACWLPKFEGSGQNKALLQARIIYRGNVELGPELTGAVNYDVTQPQSPSQGSDETGTTWGTGTWGTGTWGASTAKTVSSEWQSVAGVGFATSIWTKATSARTTAPDIDVIGLEYLCEAGNHI